MSARYAPRPRRIELRWFEHSAALRTDDRVLAEIKEFSFAAVATAFRAKLGFCHVGFPMSDRRSEERQDLRAALRLFGRPAIWYVAAILEIIYGVDCLRASNSFAEGSSRGWRPHLPGWALSIERNYQLCNRFAWGLDVDVTRHGLISSAGANNWKTPPASKG